METIGQMREEFAAWLSNETWAWTTYATLTFERPMRKDALRFARAWVRFIARTAGEVWGFCFQETHSDGHTLLVICEEKFAREAERSGDVVVVVPKVRKVSSRDRAKAEHANTTLYKTCVHEARALYGIDEPQ